MRSCQPCLVVPMTSALPKRSSSGMPACTSRQQAGASLPRPSQRGTLLHASGARWCRPAPVPPASASPAQRVAPSSPASACPACMQRQQACHRAGTLEVDSSGQLAKRHVRPIVSGASSAVNAPLTAPPKISKRPPTLGSACAGVPRHCTSGSRQQRAELEVCCKLRRGQAARVGPSPEHTTAGPRVKAWSLRASVKHSYRSCLRA